MSLTRNFDAAAHKARKLLWDNETSNYEKGPELLNNETLRGLSNATPPVEVDILKVDTDNNIAFLGLMKKTAADGLTAHSGGTQAAALPLTKMVNRVSTVAAAGDSVALPAAAVGMEVVVINAGAFPMQVFGSGTDTINGIATATGISLGVGAAARYYCVTAGAWQIGTSGATNATPVVVAGDAAINPHQSQIYVLTKGSAAALTLAAPTATTDDGVIIEITSNTAFAHVLTATGLLQTGAAAVNTATCAAHPGASLRLMAYQAKWNVLSANTITFA